MKPMQLTYHHQFSHSAYELTAWSYLPTLKQQMLTKCWQTYLRGVHVPSKFQHSRQALVKKALCKWLGWNGLVEIETELIKNQNLYTSIVSPKATISSSPMSKPVLLVHLQWLFCWESVPFCQPRRSFHFAPPAPRRTRHPHQQLQKHQAPPRHLRWKTKAPPPLVQRKHSWKTIRSRCLMVFVARMKRKSHNLSFKQLQVTKISIMHTYGY